MADDNNVNSKSSVARDFSGLPMKSLIGAPLKAASDANSMLAKSQIQLILSTCFNKQEGSDNIEPIMVNFKVSRSVVGKDGAIGPGPSLDMSIPMISLLPISSLAVEKLKIVFDMEIKSSNIRTSNLKSKAPNDGDDSGGEFYGSLSSSGKDSQSSKTSYHVELEAGTLPLPVGLRSMLEIFNKTIMPLPKEN